MLQFWRQFLLFESGAPPAGGDPAGDGGKPDADKGAGGKSDPAPDEGPMIPKARFDEVNTALKKLQQAEESRARKEAAEKGEHEKIATQERERAEKLATALKAKALQGAFLTAATGKVVDLEAAYRLADLDTLTVDDEGNVSGDVAKIVDATVKKYPFLQPGRGQPSDQPVNGNGIEQNRDPSKMSSSEKIRLGYEQAISQMPVQRRGQFGQNPNG